MSILRNEFWNFKKYDKSNGWCWATRCRMSACEVGFGLAWVSDLHLPALPPTHPPHAGAQCATAAHRIEIQAPAPCKPARPVWTKKFQKSTSTISHLPNNGLGEKILGQCALSSFCPYLLKCWLAKLKSTNYSGRHRFTKTRLLCDADQETALKNKTAQNAPLPISSRGSAIRVK